jgi:GNAT superfamily N-acetyltransferase
VTSLEFTLAPATEEHWHCILKSWLRAYVQSCRSDRNYYTRKHTEIHHYKERGADFIVATPPDDKDLIIGWGCGEKPVVHFVYVKPPYRGQGVARVIVAALLKSPADLIAYTHRTVISDAIQQTHQSAMRLVTMG